MFINQKELIIPEDILWNHRFVDIVKVRANGSYYIEDHKFHDVISCDLQF